MQWLLPAGIEDTLPPGVKRLESARNVVLKLFDSWGYDQIIPPLAEFQESLLTGVGQDLADQTFRLMDPQTGKMLGIRADMTPQAARVAARHFDLSRPVRLCYLGSTLQARPTSVHRSRSPLQVGAELFGESGSAGDVEIVRLMVASLQSLGVTDFVLALGHVGIFHALAEQAGLDSEQKTRYFDILQRKALTEIDIFLGSISIPDQLREDLRRLVDMHGDAEVLDEAR
ncbi:MAG: ATP phosphoribosyltransferase regulatory subunit, partial [Gammaproteobacteria bacterium]